MLPIFMDFILLQRHNLTKRIADNVRAARAEVTPSVINDYFKNLAVSLENIRGQNIYNYDETNPIDDPEGKTV